MICHRVRKDKVFCVRGRGILCCFVLTPLEGPNAVIANAKVISSLSLSLSSLSLSLSLSISI